VWDNHGPIYNRRLYTAAGYLGVGHMATISAEGLLVTWGSVSIRDGCTVKIVRLGSRQDRASLFTLRCLVHSSHRHNALTTVTCASYSYVLLGGIRFSSVFSRRSAARSLVYDRLFTTLLITAMSIRSPQSSRGKRQECTLAWDRFRVFRFAYNDEISVHRVDWGSVLA
jgi:hypothetical protein